MLEFTPVDKFHITGRGDVYVVRFNPPIPLAEMLKYTGQEANFVGFGRFKIIATEFQGCGNQRHAGFSVGAKLER